MRRVRGGWCGLSDGFVAAVNTRSSDIRIRASDDPRTELRAGLVQYGKRLRIGVIRNGRYEMAGIFDRTQASAVANGLLDLIATIEPEA